MGIDIRMLGHDWLEILLEAIFNKKPNYKMENHKGARVTYKN